MPTYTKAFVVLFVGLLGSACNANLIAYQRICQLRLDFSPDQVTLSDNQRKQLRDLALTASKEKFKLTVVRNGTSSMSTNQERALLSQIGREIFNNGVLNQNIVTESHFDGSASSGMIFATCKESL